MTNAIPLTPALALAIQSFRAAERKHDNGTPIRRDEAFMRSALAVALVVNAMTIAIPDDELRARAESAGDDE